MAGEMEGAVGTLAMTIPLVILAKTATDIATNRRNHQQRADLESHRHAPKVKTTYYE